MVSFVVCILYQDKKIIKPLRYKLHTVKRTFQRVQLKCCDECTQLHNNPTVKVDSIPATSQSLLASLTALPPPGNQICFLSL